VAGEGGGLSAPRFWCGVKTFEVYGFRFRVWGMGVSGQGLGVGGQGLWVRGEGSKVER
jgi:hypothetical protein